MLLTAAVVCIIALWRMRRWSVPAYALVVLGTNAFYAIASQWSPSLLLVPAVIRILAYSQSDALD